MAYQMAATAVTLDDLEGHSPVSALFKCNPLNICAAFYTTSTDSVLAQFLCISRASCYNSSCSSFTLLHYVKFRRRPHNEHAQENRKKTETQKYTESELDMDRVNTRGSLGQIETCHILNKNLLSLVWCTQFLNAHFSFYIRTIIIHWIDTKGDIDANIQLLLPTEPFKVQWRQTVTLTSVQCHPRLTYIYLISDIRELWRSALIAGVPEC